MLRHTARCSRAFRGPIVRTNFTTTNKSVVWLSDMLQVEKRGRYILYTILFGATLIPTVRYFRNATLEEKNRSILLESSYNRSLGDQVLTLPANLQPTSTYLSNLSLEDSSIPLSTTQKLSLHGLLLKMISSCIILLILRIFPIESILIFFFRTSKWNTDTRGMQRNHTIHSSTHRPPRSNSKIKSFRIIVIVY